MRGKRGVMMPATNILTAWLRFKGLTLPRKQWYSIPRVQSKIPQFKRKRHISHFLIISANAGALHPTLCATAAASVDIARINNSCFSVTYRTVQIQICLDTRGPQWVRHEFETSARPVLVPGDVVRRQSQNPPLEDGLVLSSGA